MEPKQCHTSFKMLADFVSVDRNAVNCTSSYSYGMVWAWKWRLNKDQPTVSNSSRKALFSLAGKDAIKAERERSIAWSFFAWPSHTSQFHRTWEKDMSLPTITSVTYCIRTKIRSCNIFIAARWVCKCDSTAKLLSIRIILWLETHSLFHRRLLWRSNRQLCALLPLSLRCTQLR